MIYLKSIFFCILYLSLNIALFFFIKSFLVHSTVFLNIVNGSDNHKVQSIWFYYVTLLNSLPKNFSFAAKYFFCNLQISQRCYIHSCDVGLCCFKYELLKVLFFNLLIFDDAECSHLNAHIKIWDPICFTWVAPVCLWLCLLFDYIYGCYLQAY